MDAYIHSLIAYATVANIVAVPLILLGRKFKLRLHPLEYLALYLNWLLFTLLVGSAFDSLDDAMQQLEVSATKLSAIFGAAGFFGGLSLLPKILLSGKNVNSVLITLFTSLFISVIYAKFAVLAFLFTAEGA